jgi:hypothetical protein
MEDAHFDGFGGAGGRSTEEGEAEDGQPSSGDEFEALRHGVGFSLGHTNPTVFPGDPLQPGDQIGAPRRSPVFPREERAKRTIAAD